MRCSPGRAARLLFCSYRTQGHHYASSPTEHRPSTNDRTPHASMPLRSYFKGSDIYLECLVTDVDNNATDPESIAFAVVPYGETQDTYTYGTDDEVTKLSEGLYRCTLPIASDDPSGRWKWGVITTAPTMTEEDVFVVRDTTITLPE